MKRTKEVPAPGANGKHGRRPAKKPKPVKLTGAAAEMFAELEAKATAEMESDARLARVSRLAIWLQQVRYRICELMASVDAVRNEAKENPELADLLGSNNCLFGIYQGLEHADQDATTQMMALDGPLIDPLDAGGAL